MTSKFQQAVEQGKSEFGESDGARMAAKEKKKRKQEAMLAAETSSGESFEEYIEKLELRPSEHKRVSNLQIGHFEYLWRDLPGLEYECRNIRKLSANVGHVDAILDAGIPNLGLMPY